VRAAIFAAGVGQRLTGAQGPPKALLSFAGRSLLARHLDILASLGVDEVVVGTGYRAEAIAAEVAALGAGGRVRLVHNERFREGSVVTLWSLREAVLGGGEVLIMDADVLYDRRILARLVESPHADCLLIDRGFEPGEEPVKVCLADGRIVEFRKRVEVAYDTVGESVGFFRFGEAQARRLIAAAESYVAGGRADAPHEEAIRDLLLAQPGAFGIEDVTGLPWIEIDFPGDVARAEREILPKLAE
jgi:choline kinase